MVSPKIIREKDENNGTIVTVTATEVCDKQTYWFNKAGLSRDQHEIHLGQQFTIAKGTVFDASHIFMKVEGINASKAPKQEDCGFVLRSYPISRTSRSAEGLRVSFADGEECKPALLVGAQIVGIATAATSRKGTGGGNVWGRLCSLTMLEGQDRSNAVKAGRVACSRFFTVDKDGKDVEVRGTEPSLSKARVANIWAYLTRAASKADVVLTITSLDFVESGTYAGTPYSTVYCRFRVEEVK